MSRIYERLNRLEQQLVKEPEIITDVVMLEDGRFMCSPSPCVPCEVETFELPVIVLPGSPLEKYCREIYQRENSLKHEER